MAPNLKHRSILLQTIDLDLVQPVKAGFAPLTSEAAAPAQPVKAFEPDSSSYWEWSVENDEEINKIVDEERFSADHIVNNILCQSLPEPSSTSAANDQYWDWSHAPQKSADYWNWSTPKVKQPEQSRQQESISSESYWAW